MERYRYHKLYTPKTRAERISDTVEFPAKTFNMPHMSSVDATYHDAQDCIYVIQNPVPAIHQVKLGNGHKESVNNLAKIFRESNPPAVPPRVTVGEEGQKKLQEVIHKVTQMKSAPQSAC